VPPYLRHLSPFSTYNTYICLACIPLPLPYLCLCFLHTSCVVPWEGRVCGPCE
jgi:hypothetical protein